jgi:tRNA(fMet)-specific endonuclease VapC
MRRVDVLPWDSAIAKREGTVRAEIDRRGKIFTPLDLLIAMHALDVGAALLTTDGAFDYFPGLYVEDWKR